MTILKIAYKLLHEAKSFFPSIKCSTSICVEDQGLSFESSMHRQVKTERLEHLVPFCKFPVCFHILRIGSLSGLRLSFLSIFVTYKTTMNMEKRKNIENFLFVCLLSRALRTKF
jgi:hypothetical protein